MKRFTARKDRRTVILGIVENLRVDEHQKTLYRQALDLLDLSGMEELYLNLVEVFKKIEDREVLATFGSNQRQVSGVRKREAEEASRETNSVNILLDNI